MGKTRSERGAQFIEESVREAEFAWIEFRDSAVGRQAYITIRHSHHEPLWVARRPAVEYNMNTEDVIILRAAARTGLPLVTYDQITIPPLLVRLAEEGFSHGGVIFVDHNTIASNDFGGLVRALIAFWDDKHEFDWENRLDYLRAAPR